MALPVPVAFLHGLVLGLFFDNGVRETRWALQYFCKLSVVVLGYRGPRHILFARQPALSPSGEGRGVAERGWTRGGHSGRHDREINQ